MPSQVDTALRAPNAGRSTNARHVDSWPRHDARIEVNVLHVTFEVAIIADGMFPVLGLPDSATAVTDATQASYALVATDFEPALSELFLEPTQSP
jgi:hypothetical protein